MLDLPTPPELRAERLRRGLTQAELAARAGISQSMVARVERETVDPSLSTLRAMVDALNAARSDEATAGELMTADVSRLAADDTIGSAVRVMRAKGFSQMPVLEGEVPVGSLSEADVVHLLGPDQPEHLANRRVREVMGPPLPSVAPGASAQVARRLLEDHAAVLVVERGRVLGILTKSDLLGTID